jgi:hypothetical protein
MEKKKLPATMKKNFGQVAARRDPKRLLPIHLELDHIFDRWDLKPAWVAITTPKSICDTPRST